ncbi:MAG: hypothetical protein ABF760_04765 [Zymomonas mobilis]
MTESQKKEMEAPVFQKSGGEGVMKAIGSDDRRMHVRAYNFWLSVLNGHKIPLVSDFDPSAIVDFGRHSFLLDFRENPHNPKIAFLGYALRELDKLTYHVNHISDAHEGSLIAHMATASHFSEVIEQKGPIGFEADFKNHSGQALVYRGIFMPFSSDGEHIDHLYGVVNWKILSEADSASTSPLLQAISTELPAVDIGDPDDSKTVRPVLPMIKAGDSLAALKKAPAQAIVDLGPITKDFVLLLGRREKDDQLSIVAMVEKDNEGLNQLLKNL